MNIIAAYQMVGTYRGAAQICGVTHKTVRRVIERAQARPGRFSKEPGGPMRRRPAARPCPATTNSPWTTARVRTLGRGNRCPSRRCSEPSAGRPRRACHWRVSGPTTFVGVGRTSARTARIRPVAGRGTDPPPARHRPQQRPSRKRMNQVSGRGPRRTPRLQLTQVRDRDADEPNQGTDGTRPKVPPSSPVERRSTVGRCRPHRTRPRSPGCSTTASPPATWTPCAR